jgi:hypothetical protein
MRAVESVMEGSDRPARRSNFGSNLNHTFEQERLRFNSRREAAALGLHGGAMGAPHWSRRRTSYGARWHEIFGAKQHGGHEESYLGFGRREEVVPRARGEGVLPCSTDFDVSGAMAIF